MVLRVQHLPHHPILQKKVKIHRRKGPAYYHNHSHNAGKELISSPEFLLPTPVLKLLGVEVVK